MDTLNRIVRGLVVAVTIALGLTASGGDAYAKAKATDGVLVNNDTGGITITVTTPTDGSFFLGVTWE